MALILCRYTMVVFVMVCTCVCMWVSVCIYMRARACVCVCASFCVWGSVYVCILCILCIVCEYVYVYQSQNHKGCEIMSSLLVWSIFNVSNNITPIYTYKTWILSVCMSVCLCFPKLPKVVASRNFGSKRHLCLVGTWRSPIFDFFHFYGF